MNLSKVIQIISGKFSKWFCLTSIIFFCATHLSAQKKLLVGQVYAAISNQSTAGIMVDAGASGTSFTDAKGYFSLYVEPTDTLYYYLNLHRSPPYLVKNITDWDHYAIAIQTIIYDMTQAARTAAPSDGVDPNTGLDNVTVVSRNYHKDSLENRIEYDKIFTYKNPAFNPFSPVSSIANLLNVKKKKRMKRMKNTLLFEEQQGYIDTRFNRTSITKSIGKSLEDSVLTSYMQKYRPTYEEALGMENITMVMYIRKTFSLFEQGIDKIPEGKENKGK